MELFDPHAWNVRRATRTVVVLLSATAFGVSGHAGYEAAKSIPAEIGHMAAVEINPLAQTVNDKIQRVNDATRNLPVIGDSLQIPTIPTQEPSPVSDSLPVHVVRVAIGQEAVSRYNSLSFSRTAALSADTGLAGLLGLGVVIGLRPSRLEKNGRKIMRQLAESYDLSDERLAEIAEKKHLLIQDAVEMGPNGVDMAFLQKRQRDQEMAARRAALQQQAHMQQSCYYPR